MREDVLYMPVNSMCQQLFTEFFTSPARWSVLEMEYYIS